MKNYHYIPFTGASLLKYITRSYLIIFLFFLFSISKAQTFNGSGGTIPNIGNVSFPINVTGVGTIDGTYGVSSVCINLNHNTPNRDLEIILKAPDGTNVPLSMQNGAGNNFTNTCFSASAATSIRNGTAPYTGTFIPDAYLGSVNNGQNANGAWRLLINDRRNNSGSATLFSWSITFSNTPAPPAPAMPPCSVTLPAGTSCAAATPICDFSGLCGSTTGNTVSDWPNSNLDNCFGLENNTFLKFVASGTSATFSVWVLNYTSGNYLNSGIQMIFFSGTCDVGPVTPLGCYPHILPFENPAKPFANIITATGLVPGNTYYLMIDGFAGDHCNFIVETTQTINQVTVNPSAPDICEGDNVVLTASGGGGTYNWTPATGLSATAGSVVTASPSATTTYTVTSVMNGVCPATKNVTVTVHDKPVVTASPSPGPVNVCQNQTVPSLSVSGTTATGTLSYQWYSNTVSANSGGTFLTSASNPTFTPQNSTPGTLFYYCVITNTSGCADTSNISGAITIKPAPADPALTLTQAISCSVPSAIVTINSPVGVTYQYSTGGPYQSNPVFTGLGAGTVNFTVKDLVSGCFSNPVGITISGATGAPPAPSVSLTQPGCGQIKGDMNITAPLGAGYEYSIGGAYQASPNFNALSPGSYSVTVKDVATGCISSATMATINPGLTTPTVPNAFASHQPDCTNTSGTIVITSPVNPNHEYAVNGNYQSSPTFTGLTPGFYVVTVRNIITGCESLSANIMINNIPPPPATAVVNITNQPTCASPSGAFTIASPLGAFTYSIGGPYQASVNFSGLAPGNYSLTVKDAGGCVSVPATVTINPPTGAPVAPTVSITTQPTCDAPTASILITAPTGPNLEYSIGGAYQPSGVFTGLALGSYQVSVKNTSTGCVSAATVINVVAATPPAAVSASVTVQPTCNIPTGTITVSNPLSSNYQYSVGATYQASTIFAGLAPGNYSVTVKDITTGCISAATGLTVDAIPGAPATPVISITQPADCASLGASIVVTPVSGVEYGLDGVYQPGNSFNIVAPGNHNITVRDLVTGCVSQQVNAVVNNIPSAPPAPSVTINTQPTCANNTGSVTVTNPVTGVLFGINGNYQSSASFTNLTPGNYLITTKTDPGGCISLPANITINPPPGAPAAPVITITQQPTCADPTGAMDITSPIGANLQFSIGGSYQTSPIFTGLAPGTYSVTTKDVGSGCISSSSALVINAVPVAPAVSGSVTQQPSCVNPQGVITVTAPLGAQYSYSLGGTYQAGITFNVIAATYQLTVRDNSTGCVSAALAIVVNAATGVPATPHIQQVQQPTCITPMGAFSVNSPLGASLSYSSGGAYQSSPNFSNLMPGNYQVSVKDNTTGCISNGIQVVINPVPAPPVAPTVSITNPDCSSATGVFHVTSPLGNQYSYSVGGPYQAAALFTGVVPGVYNVTVKDISTGCISAPVTAVIGSAPVSPSAPTASGVSRCGAGVVQIIANGSGTIRWYSDAGLTNEVYSGNTLSIQVFNTTSYYLTADNGGCVSLVTTVQATVLPVPKPNLGNDTIICPGDKLVLSPGGFTQYVWNNGTNLSSLTVSVPGIYSVQVTNAAGCTSSDDIKVTVADNCSVVYFPSAFTPNRDYLNDGFGPLPRSIHARLKEYKLNIYNRYGQMVFSSSDPSQQWDGTFGGMYNPGTFTWYCHYTLNGKKQMQKGTVIVLK